jgi:hypothetical protein
MFAFKDIEKINLSQKRVNKKMARKLQKYG